MEALSVVGLVLLGVLLDRWFFFERAAARAEQRFVEGAALYTQGEITAIAREAEGAMRQASEGRRFE